MLYLNLDTFCFLAIKLFCLNIYNFVSYLEKLFGLNVNEILQLIQNVMYHKFP